MSKKKYSTIIYTDVVGYSRLTGENQELALELLSEHDKILYQTTKHYSGRIIKQTGDGICAMFDDPNQAIKCSVDIQKDLNKRNTLNIKERQVKIRIGIHYDTYVEKKGDIYGDGIAIAKQIESLSPHGGIAISESVNSLIMSANDIYTREFIKMNYNDKDIQLFEVYSDLLQWFYNEKNQETINIDSQKAYSQAHDFFHNSDYSTSLKYACIALQGAKKSEEYNIESFMTHLLISLGEFKAAEKELCKLKTLLSDDVEIELEAHLYKMEASLLFNSQKYLKSKELYIKSLDIMKSVNVRYCNELVVSIGNICLLKNSMNDFKYKSSIDDDYSFLIEGLNLVKKNNLKNNEISDYVSNLKQLKNIHLKSICYWYAAISAKNNKNIELKDNFISKSQDLLISSSEKISDWFQREAFLKNIVLHNEIINFYDNEVDDLSDLELDLKETVSVNSNKNASNKALCYKFCTNCGYNNSKQYKFCIECGNNLEVK